MKSDALSTEEEIGPDGLTVLQWARERLENCHLIADTKTDQADIRGWMDDAWYWRKIVEQLSRG